MLYVSDKGSRCFLPVATRGLGEITTGITAFISNRLWIVNPDTPLEPSSAKGLGSCPGIRGPIRGQPWATSWHSKSSKATV